LLDSHSRSGGPAVAEELGFNLLVLLLASGRGLRLHQPYALFFVKRFFETGSHELLSRLASNHDPPDLCPLSR
jgi:hypothetical protein